MRKLHFTAAHLGWFILLTVTGVIFGQGLMQVGAEEYLRRFVSWVLYLAVPALIFFGLLLVTYANRRNK